MSGSVIANVLYNTATLPRWDGTDAPPQPSLANNTGYDVTAPQLSPAVRNAAYERANGNLCNGHFWWPVFVTDVSIDIALAGFTAQSRMTRDFYPHNFTQPSFVVGGQAIDQRDYGTLTDFVHYAQRSSLINNGQLMQLYIKGWGYQGHRHATEGVTRNNKRYTNQIIRGPHESILCQGYVNQMPRQHQRGVYAPEYTFSFVVADEILGPFHENLVLNTQQATWVDILKSTDTFKVNQALLKENNDILTWAKNNSANIFNSGNTGSNTGSTTGHGGWQTVTATFFTDSSGSCASNLNDGNNYYAELNGGTAPGPPTTMGNAQLGPLFGSGSGGLACGFKLEVRNPANGKTVVATKGDTGAGAPGAKIDLHQTLSDAIGFTSIGKGPIEIRAA